MGNSQENLYFPFSWNVGELDDLATCQPFLGASRPERACPFYFRTPQRVLDSWIPKADGTCHLPPHLCCWFSCLEKYFSERNLIERSSWFLVAFAFTITDSREHDVVDAVVPRTSGIARYPEGEWEVESFYFTAVPVHRTH